MKNAIAGSVLLLVGAGCAYDEDEPEQTTAPIINAPLSKSFAGQVMLFGGSCSGTVLSEHWVLTAAHCVDDFGQFFDIELWAATSTSGQPVLAYDGPVEAFVHPAYNPQPTDANDDVALLHLRGYGIETSTIGRAPLYADSRTPWVTSPLTASWISGWGRTTTSTCLDTTLFDPYARVLRTVNATISNYSSMLVRTNRNVCKGDSGGPWYYKPGTTGTILFMQLALSSLIRDGVSLGTLLPPKRSWIESTMASRVPHLFGFSWNSGTTGGYTYRQYVEKNTVVGNFVHQGNWCLTASSTAQEAPIVLAPCDGRWTQAWWITPTGAIKSLADTNMCMDVQWAGNTNGTPLWMWPCSNALFEPAQRFRFESSGVIRTGVDFDKCVDLPWNEAWDGAPLQIYDCNWSSAQTWVF